MFYDYAQTLTNDNIQSVNMQSVNMQGDEHNYNNVRTQE